MLRLITALQSRLIREEEGAGMVEYALLVALIGIVLIGALAVLTGSIGTLYDRVSATLGAA